MTNPRTQHIVVIDDDPQVRASIDALLSGAGFLVTVFGDGLEGARYLEQPGSACDAVLLDITMPSMDGFTVCHRLRATLARYVPIIMLTARVDGPARVLGLDIGADAYLTKPFDPRELIAQIRSVIRRADMTESRPEFDGAARRSLALRCGAITLWDDEHRVEVAGRSVELTPKEYQLLRHFMNAPDRVFGRETLLRDVWGYDFPGDTRTVDAHAQRLRAKLAGAAPDIDYLQTVRGFGYRLKCPAAPA